VKVVEGNTNTFDGVIGYVPSQLGQPGYFTGMIDVSMTDLFGTGRKFRAMWHQETKLTQQLEIDYGEPYIFGLPLNAEVDFKQRQQDSTSVTRNFGVSGIFLFSDNFNADLSLNTLTTTPLLNSSNYYSVYQSSVLNLGVGVMYDTRNDIYSPTRGVLYETQLQFGQKRIYGPEQLITPDTRLTSYTQHLTVGLSLFHEFIPRQILAVGIHGEQVTGTELDQSDMYRIGGTNTDSRLRRESIPCYQSGLDEYRVQIRHGEGVFLLRFHRRRLHIHAERPAREPAVQLDLRLRLRSGSSGGNGPRHS